MVNCMRIIDETVRITKIHAGFTTGELSMFLDIFNGTHLTPSALDKSSLDAQVEDSFDLYPMMYEEKWGVEKESLLEKIDSITDFQAACLQIWAADFWASEAYQRPQSVSEYVAGTLSVASLLNEASREVLEAKSLCAGFKKTGVKSKMIAQAVQCCEKAETLLFGVL